MTIIYITLAMLHSYATIHRAPPGAVWGGLARTSVRRIRTTMYPIWIQLGYMAVVPGLWAAPFLAPMLALCVVWRVVSPGMRAQKCPHIAVFQSFDTCQRINHSAQLRRSGAVSGVPGCPMISPGWYFFRRRPPHVSPHSPIFGQNLIDGCVPYADNSPASHKNGSIFGFHLITSIIHSRT